MSDTAPSPHPGMGFGQFVALIAAMMATNALAIDSMLPALPHIGEALGIHDPNARQWVITSYLLGFGVAQLVYGSLADRYGRKPVLMVGLTLYTLFAALCAFSTSFEMLLIARFLTGLGAASTRVLAVSIVRDCYAGRQMARVMSLAFIVFLATPVIAPSLGQAIMLFASWRWIFGVLSIFGLIVIAWAAIKLPETQHPEDRIPISVAGVTSAFKIALTDRIAMGYTLAAALVLSGLFGFLNSAQQVFVDVLGAGDIFPLIFAGIAGAMAVSSLLNSRIVERLGMRKVSHWALIGFIGVAAAHAVVAMTGHETLWTFALMQAAMMFCFGLVMSNFGAIAMEPLGHVAGAAASIQGFITTIGGALCGFVIGQLFDGTTVPLTLGFTGFGLAGLLMVLATEKGKLFQTGAVSPAPAAAH
ncbi:MULTISPECIES: multidrug effflux MFS transporter [unclassified Caulobacter]|jgi:DHA1 family bicyclomycin/chloramphenicol resistance-like MFS transporter|uniref:multidrug effflux MFS transporter n=1 Tax=unclassified Caulobacter TaxID=2648921 RepID=UPI000B078AFC|nr:MULTISPECIES: multidrug effflux MFS transporter [unclassified Caulobacter]